MRTLSGDIFIKRSWKNFLLSAGIWFAAILVYMVLGNAQRKVPTALWFYIRYTWPSFLLCYATVVWLIPEFLHKKKFQLFGCLLVGMLILYCIVRYYNHILQNPEMYVFYRKVGDNLMPIKSSFRNIFSIEIIRGLEFIFIAFCYRFIIDWTIMEKEKIRLEKEKIQADLTMLRHQLNPHFLFNTINDIYYLALIQSPRTADAMLELSELLRYVLHEKDDIVPLEKELDHLKRFIHLHHFRFPDDVIKFTLDNTDPSDKFGIPPLLLQSFAENAFKHGKPGTDEEPIIISIDIRDGRLLYKVVNAIGSRLSKDDSNGIGIKNLEQRLALLFPDRHSLSIEEHDDQYIAQMEIPLEKR